MTNYLIQGETLTAIADKVRSKLDDTNLVTPEEIPSAVDAVYEKGKKSEYDKFWDIYQTYGKRDNYSNAFALTYWRDEIYNPKYPIVSSMCNNLFGNNNSITDTKVTIDISSGGQVYGLFNACSKLVTIRKLIVSSVTPFASGGVSSFSGCSSLVNISIEGIIGKVFNISATKKLSKASIINIINCLSTTTNGIAATFSQTAVDNAFETSEGAADGSTSTEWTTLIATKSNWTISLA
jgi:hypothetical protein